MQVAVSRPTTSSIHARGLVPTGDLKRAGGFKGLQQLILRFGGDPAALLEEFGIAAADLDDPECYLSYPAVIRLLEACAKRLDAPHFGFELGKGQSADVLGPLAAILLASPTIGDGLTLLSRFMSVHAPGGRYAFEVEGTEARISYRVLHAESTFCQQINEMTVTVAFNVLKMMAGPDFRPIRIEIAADKPLRRSELLASYFHAPVHYECPVNIIAIPARYVEQRIDSSNPALLRLAEAHLESLTRVNDVGIEEQVEQAVRRLLPVGECSLPNIAQQLGMHSRSLQNRLMEAGVEFRELLQAERQRLAFAYLATTHTPLAEIAFLLGYSDQAAFTRAFASWTGTSPLKYRKLSVANRAMADATSRSWYEAHA